MKNKELGQAFIYVLITLAIGAMLVVPLLRLSSTVVRGSRTLTNQTRALYAAEGAQEYVMWKLLHKNWAQSFTNPGEEGYLSIENCGITMEATIIMRAIPGEGGMTLATDDVIQPTKTVEPSSVPLKSLYDYTYTLNLEQISSDNSEGLDAIYDILPGGMTDYIGPTEISLDDGETWQVVPDPEWIASSDVLKWPADYDKDTGTVKGWVVRFFPAEQFRKRTADFVGPCNTSQNNRNCQQPENKKPFPVVKDGIGNRQFPLRMGFCAHHHESSPFSKESH